MEDSPVPPPLQDNSERAVRSRAAGEEVPLLDSPKEPEMSQNIKPEVEGPSAAMTDGEEEVKEEEEEQEEQEEKKVRVKGVLALKEDKLGRPKLSRLPSNKMVKIEPRLFDDLPSARDQAATIFQEIEESSYQNKSLGESGGDEILSCDCKPDFECSCGDACRNQRFQRREYAAIDVIQTEKKGYGLRAMADFPADVFVYEYVGEVIAEQKFRQRMKQYDREGERHFYFMMLQKGEYIDATKKGGYGRFINHSCNPNCYVDKWVVGTKLRMGIFAKRAIHAGEELSFDYNVDRYGAKATPCYCGEANCLGYIGGKTQTEAANKLPQNVAEALGIDEAETWDDAKPSKNRRRKKGEKDEEYVNDLVPRSIEAKDVSKIMSTLLQSTERWLLKALLARIHNDTNQDIQLAIIALHGYQTLGAKLDKWKEDAEIAKLVLEILHKWPRVAKNKISSSKIESHVKTISETCADKTVKSLAIELLDLWSKLEMAYRIPRRIRPKVEEKSLVSSDSKQTASHAVNGNHRTESVQAKNLTIPTQPRNNVKRYQQSWRQPRRDFSMGVSRSFPEPTKVAPVMPGIDLGLQAIIDAAKEQQERAAKLAEEEKAAKLKVEQDREKFELAKREEREKKIEEHRIKKEKHALDKKQREALKEGREKVRQSKSSREKVRDQNKERLQLERKFAKAVPNLIAKYQVTLGKDEFKKRAKEIVKILVDKEMKKEAPNLKEIDSHTKNKLKVFARSFMDKLLAHKGIQFINSTTVLIPGSNDKDIGSGTPESAQSPDLGEVDNEAERRETPQEGNSSSPAASQHSEASAVNQELRNSEIVDELSDCKHHKTLETTGYKRSIDNHGAHADDPKKRKVMP